MPLPACRTSPNRVPYPVVLGEISFQDNPYTEPGAPDGLFWNSLVDYMLKQGPANTSAYPHNPIDNWFWWCWNANSGEFTMLEQNWVDFKWFKVEAMMRVGLRPWFLDP